MSGGAARQLPNPWKAFFLSLFFSSLALALLLFGDRGTDAWRRSNDEARRLSREIAQVRAENDALTARLARMQTDDFELEKNARESLGLVGRDEVVFQLPTPAPQTSKSARTSATGAGRASR
jgi:cell division protein FtsB